MKTIKLPLVLAFLPGFFPFGAFAQDMGNAPNPFQIETKGVQYVKTDVQTARKALPAERAALPQETSAYETFVGVGIRQFGYAFFNKAPSTFAPADNVPVTADYLVGPGDEIVISIWGKVEARFTLEVSREGNISIPKVGLVNVSGLTFSELKESLTKEISKYYTDLNLNISMGSLRSISVYVVPRRNQRAPYGLAKKMLLVQSQAYRQPAVC